MQGLREIVAQRRVGGLRIRRSLQLRLIEADKFFPFARLFTKTVVGNSIKPGRKFRFATEAAEVFVGAEKRLLGKVVCEGKIRPNELTKKAAHSRLMISHQLRKGVVVVIEKNTSDEVCIG